MGFIDTINSRETRKRDRGNEVTTITVKVPKSLYNEARKRSDRTGVSVSFVVRKALSDWLQSKV